MTEEIIIDGINVAGCRHLKNNGIKNPICWSGGCISAYNSCLCKDNIDCDYKQLIRLEHENKVNLSRAKDLNTELQRLTDENFNLKQALEEIKNKAEHCLKQDVCSLCEYKEICAVPDEHGLVYDNNRLLIKLIDEVLNESK